MKPAQKLKGARLEAGQTQERDDASLLAHREESKDAVKSRRAFLRFVLVSYWAKPTLAILPFSKAKSIFPV